MRGSASHAATAAAAADLRRFRPSIRIHGLVARLADEYDQNERLAGESGASLRAAITRFEPLMVEKEFAERAYASALASLELARVDAARQHRYLVTLTGPSDPSDATHPNVLWSILTFLVFSLAAMGIGTLLIASVREHANV